MKIQVLNGNKVERIKHITEKMIEETGFKVEHVQLLKIAAKAGAIVDEVNQVIRIPAELLRELLKTVPKSYIIRGIDNKEYRIGGDNQYISAIVTDPWIIDYDTKAPRRPCLEDVRKNTILSQVNEQVAQVSRMDFPVTDYPDPGSSLKALESHLLNHTKHYSVYAASLESLFQWMEIGKILAQGNDLSQSALMTLAVAVISPLRLSGLNCQIMMEAAANNLTVIPTICPMAGTTSPFSKDATLLQGNVENIFLAAMTQMLNPGNPFLYAFGPSVSNMRTGHDLYYTIDKVLWKIASTELAKSYSMPVSAECGGTLSHRFDMQSGAESMLFMLSAQNPGASLLAGLGSCYNANGLSSEMIIIQSEWLNAVKYLGNGITMEHLEEGFESIKTQKHGGNFLTDDITLKLLESNEFFKSELLDTSGGYEISESILENAHKKVEELTSGYVSPVPAKIQEDLKRFFHDIIREKI